MDKKDKPSQEEGTARAKALRQVWEMASRLVWPMDGELEEAVGGLCMPRFIVRS